MTKGGKKKAAEGVLEKIASIEIPANERLKT